MQKNIIFEDEEIIVVNKPAGIATQTARIGQQDMVSELKNYLTKTSLAKEPYIGLVHRLDQPVSGLLVFAKTKQAAASLSKQITEGKMQKLYYAVIFGKPNASLGSLTDYLYKDNKTNSSLVVQQSFPGAKKAVLNYRFIKTMIALENRKEVSLIEIELITGRHHQIRVQMAHAGMSLLGDNKYGSREEIQFSKEAGCKNVVLYAFRLIFAHPLSGEEMIFEKQPSDTVFLPFFSKGI